MVIQVSLHVDVKREVCSPYNQIVLLNSCIVMALLSVPALTLDSTWYVCLQDREDPEDAARPTTTAAPASTSAARVSRAKAKRSKRQPLRGAASGDKKQGGGDWENV